MSTFSKQEKSWILYDVANSAFTMLISTTIPIFFRSLAEQDISAASATGIWGLSTSLAVLILAVMSPFLGALADYRGMKKKMFSVFLVVGVAGLLLLSFSGNWLGYLMLVILSRIGYSACNIFYDSMLVDVTSDDRMDRVSSYGYALGYIGSCSPFAIGIVLILLRPFGLSTQTATQISFVITALWWVGLTIPLLKNVRQIHYLEQRENQVRHAFSRVGTTMKKIRKDPTMLSFIIAYFCYIDGVYTIISMATTYGGEVGISDSSMILALLLTQFVAFPCAILAGRLAEKVGTLKVIRVSILVYCGICLFGYQLDQSWEFWVLAVVVGMAQGGIQSLSRSYFGRIIPKKESNEYFGFFDIFGKFADFFGPLILSFCAFAFGSSSYGILGLLVLFVTGYILLRRIPDTH
ncbi:MAG: MFS transporter [Negativibacillus sp.]|nr:MFS transporter [Negativibacillus sp.]